MDEGMSPGTSGPALGTVSCYYAEAPHSLTREEEGFLQRQGGNHTCEIKKRAGFTEAMPSPQKADSNLSGNE